MTPSSDIFDEHGDFSAADLRLVAEYAKLAIPVDALAYTDAFDGLYATLHKCGETRPRGEVFRRLLMLRKAGRLPRLSPAPIEQRRAESA